MEDKKEIFINNDIRCLISFKKECLTVIYKYKFSAKEVDLTISTIKKQTGINFLDLALYRIDIVKVN